MYRGKSICNVEHIYTPHNNTLRFLAMNVDKKPIMECYDRLLPSMHV